MSAPEIALEMEQLLLRTVPGLAEQWRGTMPDTIAQIERIAGRPLPPFYRWFLSRMGQSMGPLTYPTLDFSAQRVLSCYAKKLAVPNPRFLFIAHDSEEIMPLHRFYDLDAPAREDAMVTAREAGSSEHYDQFETLHEMLACSAFRRFRIDQMPQQCLGTLGEHPDILSLVEPVMSSLGFTTPIPTGPHFGLYERVDAVMLCTSTPRQELTNEVRAFELAGSNAGTLRRILGAIATETSLKIEVNEWTPALR